MNLIEYNSVIVCLLEQGFQKHNKSNLIWRSNQIRTMSLNWHLTFQQLKFEKGFQNLPTLNEILMSWCDDLYNSEKTNVKCDSCVCDSDSKHVH